MQTTRTDDRVAQVSNAGMSQTEVKAWFGDLNLSLTLESDPARLESDAALVEPIFNRGRAFLDSLPLKSKRTDSELAAGQTLVRAMAALCERFCRVHRGSMYRRLTDDYTSFLRVDDLVWRAAERWPGLLPSRDQVLREQTQMQMDKDGLEIQQGIFLSHICTERRAGLHLLQAMLKPKEESIALLSKFQELGSVDLGQVQVEARNQTGYVYFSNPRYLNAEDETLIEAQETAIDLVLLHPDLKMGVLRGAVVEHPRYRGRRVFDSGINLTKIYHGKLGYVSFYIVRDLGFVNKLYRGLMIDEWEAGEPENTLEKPWLAVVDAFAIGGGCQLLLVVDYVLAESGAYFNLPARKEGIIPGAANLRLSRFMGDRLSRQAIMFDKTFYVDSPEGATLVNQVVPRDQMDDTVEQIVANAIGSGMVSAGGNRKTMRVQQEPLDVFRAYMATYCREQVYCHLSSQLIENLEHHWNAKKRQV